MLSWQRKNVLKNRIPNKCGLYEFYDHNGNRIYVGHASKLRHRVQSYMQKDDMNAHPTKEWLRQNIAKYKFRVMPISRAIQIEKKMKQGTKYNFK